MSALEFACECCDQLACRTPRDTGVKSAHAKDRERARKAVTEFVAAVRELEGDAA